jgi:sarcosine oxidase subunit gamma
MAEAARRKLPAALLDVPARVAAHGTEWLRVLPPAVRFILQGRADARAAASPVWGVGFSDEPCRALVAGHRATLWLGPDEYLLFDAAGPADAGSTDAAAGAAAAVGAAAAAIEASLERALGDVPHSLVDVSHRQVALQLRGPHAATILNGACPLDLGLAAFPVGMCTRTVFAKADIVLWRTEPETFHVEVWRSFAAYFTGLLYELAREFQPQA